MSTRRSRNRHDGDELSEQNGQRRTTRPREDDGDNNDNRRRQRSKLHDGEKEDTDDEYKETRRDRKEKKTETFETRRYSDDDDISDDEPQNRRRERRRRRDGNDRSRRQINQRKRADDDGDDDEEEDENDGGSRRKSGERSGTRRTKGVDTNEESVQEETENARRSIRKQRNDNDQNDDSKSTRRRTRRKDSYNNEESEGRESNNEEDEDRRSLRQDNATTADTQKDEVITSNVEDITEQKGKEDEDLMKRWKNRPKFEEMEKSEEDNANLSEEETEKGRKKIPFSKCNGESEKKEVKSDDVENAQSCTESDTLPEININDLSLDVNVDKDVTENELEEKETNKKIKQEAEPSRASKPKSAKVRNDKKKKNSDENNNFEASKVKQTDNELEDSLKRIKNIPDLGKVAKSATLSNLMDTYLNKDYLIGRSKPTTLSKPQATVVEKNDESENNLNTNRLKNKKQPPPPVRNRPSRGTKSWDEPKEQLKLKNRDTQWPPKDPPKDVGAYVVESYGKTDPYSKKLIKDIQRTKREEEERRQKEKRSEVVQERTKPVSTLRSSFIHKPAKPRPGVQKPESNLAGEKSWIKHEKKPVEFDKPPDEPDWMQLIRNRRWKSTVKARFPCKSSDKTDFERRSTTPRNWKKLAKDKNALRMLSEVVGIGAEGEELFMRLANQRQKIEEEQEALDKLTEQELMAYEVARETLGEDVAYNLQMDNPLPAARMRPVLNSSSTVKEGSLYGSRDDLNSTTSSNYPYTTSQLEAAYLTNQLIRLHPEEFRKLMSLERSRQATLRWQFSSDPFDSVHEHQSLPMEIALLASQEPRIQQAMKKLLGQGDDSAFGTPAPVQYRSRRTHSEGFGSHRYAGSESDYDGYESSQSVSSNSSFGGPRGRPRKKKLPVPPPVRPRGRSASPSMMSQRFDSAKSQANPTLTGPRLNGTNRDENINDDREVQSHGLFTDEELKLSEEIAQLQEMTSNIGRGIDEELKGIEASLEDRKKDFLEEAVRQERFNKRQDVPDSIDVTEIASRRHSFIEKDLESSNTKDVREQRPKARHKVRRINSSAALDAVFRRRRQISESDVEDTDNEDTDVNDGGRQPEKATKEMTSLVKDINNTFGFQNGS